MKNIALLNSEGEHISDFTNKDEIIIDFELVYDKLQPNTSLFVSVLNQFKMPVFSEEKVITCNKMRLKIMPEFLVQGSYSLLVIVHLVPSDEYYRAEDICSFNVTDTDSKMIVYNNYNYNYGSVFGKTQWY